MVSGFPPIHLNIVRLRENYVKHGGSLVSHNECFTSDIYPYNILLNTSHLTLYFLHSRGRISVGAICKVISFVTLTRLHRHSVHYLGDAEHTPGHTA